MRRALAMASACSGGEAKALGTLVFPVKPSTDLGVGARRGLESPAGRGWRASVTWASGGRGGGTTPPPALTAPEAPEGSSLVLTPRGFGTEGTGTRSVKPAMGSLGFPGSGPSEESLGRHRAQPVRAGQGALRSGVLSAEVATGDGAPGSSRARPGTHAHALTVPLRRGQCGQRRVGGREGGPGAAGGPALRGDPARLRSQLHVRRAPSSARVAPSFPAVLWPAAKPPLTSAGRTWWGGGLHDTPSPCVHPPGPWGPLGVSGARGFSFRLVPASGLLDAFDSLA